MAKFYLTTAIDYSNGEPHLGHALEKSGADCIARYRRLAGDDVEQSQQGAQYLNCGGIDYPTLYLEPSEVRIHCFRLSAYGPRLLVLIGSGALRVEPAILRNEVVRLVEAWLHDVSISRQRLS